MSIFKKIIGWFVSAEKFAEKYIDPAIQVVQNAKLWLQNPVIDILTALTKTTADEKIVSQLRDALPRVLTNLGYAKNCLNKGDTNAILACTFQTLSMYNDNDRHNAWLNIAGTLAHDISGGEKPLTIILDLVQQLYDAKYKKP